MKHINYLFLMLSFIVLATSCKKNDPKDIELASLSVKTAFDADNATYGFDMSQLKVTATNLVTNQTYTGKTETDGTVNFSSLSPGDYNIAATLTIKASDYNAKAGTNVEDDVVFNGSISRQNVQQAASAAITLKAGRIGDFVIKQVYYAGSDIKDGALFRDQFIEIYNNSNETLYADSLYFGQVENVSAVATRIDFTKGYYQANGSWDWTKAVDMNNDKANTDYIYSKSLFMIPGTGKQYPVEPGKSIIIAANALNHKAPYTDATGKTIGVNKPELTVDLSAADFEVYLGNQDGINPLASDIDNPAVPNVVVINRGGNRDLVIDNLGRDGIMIFKTAADVKNLPRYATPDKTVVTATSTLSTQIPISYIIDGVGLQHAVAASRVPKQLPDLLDGGEIFVTGGSYSSQSVVRKTRRVVNGRIVLQDTNNSTNDFGVLIKADPSKSATSFIN
ncbi:DUF4876 domain-containing protein [Mucilaginibacter conchicola]|uniref:DUF4876 domain-containing protein n=1 Tax=Mucilaginibacter conchicola TaxID=2303333 RepID=A0A372NXN1_9SPHI|nr:DUF4876 domain-containing protein [Mucilaginibacter conchicola]RFZ94878.1 DUF4876 domain-containing protein [Mucilaginibacter conchicola]